MQSALSATPAVLTVEIEPDTVVRGRRPPAPLTRDAAELLAGQVADDLRRIVGDSVAGAGLILLGALYDLTELLRPGLPMIERMLDLYRSSLRGAPFTPNLVALGSAGGRFPLPELAPARSPGAGPMLALPFALVAPGDVLDSIRSELERDLLGKGRASLAMDQAIRQQFGVAPVNLSFATLHDISALLKVQLDHAGFGDLWRILEAGLYHPETPAAVECPSGNRFLTLHGRVWTPVPGFDQWVARQGTDDEATYLAWHKTQRQYMAGLAAHGMPVIPVHAQPGTFSEDVETALTVAQQQPLEPANRLREPLSGSPELTDAAAVTLTEHADREMGPVVYTVLAQTASGELSYLGHDYPLSPEAIAEIRSHWEEQAHRRGATFQLEQPGRLVLSGEPKRLMPYLDYADHAG